MLIKTKWWDKIIEATLRYRAVKIITGLLLNVILGIFIGLFLFTVLEGFLAYLGIKGGQFIANLWKFLNVDFLLLSIMVLSFIVPIISNPIYALVSLILVFLISAVFLISIQVEFLALIYIIIYIGAIAILFLFVIMMFNLKELRDADAHSENMDFLIINFSIFSIVYQKFDALLRYTFIMYVEYDLYINHILSLKYNIMSLKTRQLYLTFLYDYKSVLEKIISDPTLFQISLWSQVKDAASKTSINPELYLYYLARNDILDNNAIKPPTLAYDYALDKIYDSAIKYAVSPNDMIVTGYSLYTNHSYLFLLVTMVLLIAMVGAIVLALSTNETNPLDQKSTKYLKLGTKKNYGTPQNLDSYKNIGLGLCAIIIPKQPKEVIIFTVMFLVSSFLIYFIRKWIEGHLSIRQTEEI